MSRRLAWLLCLWLIGVTTAGPGLAAAHGPDDPGLSLPHHGGGAPCPDGDGHGPCDDGCPCLCCPGHGTVLYPPVSTGLGRPHRESSPVIRCGFGPPEALHPDDITRRIFRPPRPAPSIGQ